MKKIIILLFLKIFFFPGLNAQDEKRLALVIGNSNYDKGELKNPVNDARLIKSTLDSLDFEIIYGENLSTRRDMLSLIEEFEEKRDEYNVGFVYYAGHGIQINDQNYLLPTKEVFEKESHVINYAVSVQTLLRSISSRSNEANIIVLDACRDNPYESNWNMTRSSNGNGNGLAKIPPPTGSLIAFSTDSGKTAPDGVGENSIYTLSLSKNMLIEGLDILEVFTRVRAEVLEKSNGVQTTVDENKLIGKLVLKPRNLSQRIVKAEALINENKLLEALQVIEPIIEQDPTNVDARLVRARSYYNLEQYQKSIDEYDELISLDSLNPEYFIYKGLALYSINKGMETLEMFKKASEIKPSAITYYYLAEYYKLEEDYENAEKYMIKHLEKSIDEELDSQSILDANWALAVLYHNNIKNYDKAMVHYKNILNVDPDNLLIKEGDYPVFMNMGRIHHYFYEDNGSAIKNYLKQLELTPRQDIFYSISDFYSDAGDSEKAKEYLALGIQSFPNSSLLYHASAILNIYDNSEKAERDFTMAISLNPGDIGLNRDIADFYNFYDRYVDARNYYEKIIELDEDQYYVRNNHIYSELANISFYYANDEEQAFEYLRKEIEISTNPAQGYSDIGNIYEEIGDYENAELNYNKAVSLRPDDPNFILYRAEFYYYTTENWKKALNDYKISNELEESAMKSARIADCYSFLKDDFVDNKEVLSNYVEKAVEYYNKAIELDKNIISTNYVYNNLGALYENHFKNCEKAIEYYKKSIDNIPNDTKSYYNIADIYDGDGTCEAVKDLDKSIEMYEKIIEIDPKDPEVFFQLGLLYYNEIGDYQKSIDNFKLSIDLESDPLYHYNIGLAYQKNKDYEKALFNWLKAAEMSTEEENQNFAKENYLYVNIGALYEETFNDYEKALEYYDLELKADNSSYFGLKRKALLLEKMNNYEGAITYLDRLVELDYEFSIEPFMLRSNFYEFSKNNLELAYNDIKNANNRFIQNPDYEQIDGYTLNNILHKEAQFLFRQKNYTKALEVYFTIENSNPSMDFFDTVDLYSEIADSYVKLKNYSKALEYYNKELELYPNYIYTIQKKADLYAFHIKDPVSAEEWYKKGIEIEPDNNNINLSYINFLYINNKYDEVLKLAKIATERDEKDPQGHYVRALVYKNLSNPFLELTELNKCIDKIIDYTPEGYYISDTDGSILDLSKVFILRAVLFKSVNDLDSYCIDLNSALNYTDLKTQQNRIKQMINESCE